MDAEDGAEEDTEEDTERQPRRQWTTEYNTSNKKGIFCIVPLSASAITILVCNF